MSDAAPRGAISRDPAVRRIITSHRELTHRCSGIDRDAERGTLVACSGGADSVALAVALSCVSIPIIIGHVRHDIRPDHETAADRDHALKVAETLGVRFVEASVSVRGLPGNTESNARHARYAALADMAAAGGLAFVAAAHHADDVLETILMRLMRGAGPSGLAGPAPARRIGLASSHAGRTIWLLRPMLGVGRADAERICRLANDGRGFSWVTDQTNTDLRLLRNAVRARVAPILKELAPGVEIRASRAAELMRETAGVLDDRADQILKAAVRSPDSVIVPRVLLAGERGVVVGAVIRRVISDLTRGRFLDRIRAAELSRLIRAIRDGKGGSREFGWGRNSGVRVTVERDGVVIEARGDKSGSETDCARRPLRT
ncbi:MAG: tRNA lysidine(34) synthetase TilS [Phycisphaeraceae bacterium]|nr:tRNA lysidine(34) synthetase TilS [Phycisphaeraceae bacterium]